MGTEFQFRNVKHPRDGWSWEVHNNVNVLSAPELYSLIRLKSYVLYYVTFTTIKNVKKRSTKETKLCLPVSLISP